MEKWRAKKIKRWSILRQAWCVDEKKRSASHGHGATQSTHKHTAFAKSRSENFVRAQNECDGMGRVSLLILILVISLGSAAMPTTYKCIFYLSDLQFKEVRSLRLMKNYWQRKHVVVAHRFSRYRRRRRLVMFFSSFVSFAFYSKPKHFTKSYWPNEIYVNYCCAYVNFIRLGETIYAIRTRAYFINQNV